MSRGLFLYRVDPAECEQRLGLEWSGRLSWHRAAQISCVGVEGAYLEPLWQQLRSLYGECCWRCEPLELAAELLAACRHHRMRLGVAESCTGGALSAALVTQAGASEVFEGSCVSYSYWAKEQLLGVPASVLATEGPVSEACARAMAEGIVQRLRVDLAIAITGVAGPSCQSASPPVGSIYVATTLCTLEGCSTQVELLHLDGSRAQIIQQAVQIALGLARMRLK